MELRRYGSADLPLIRAVLLDVYAEVYTAQVDADPFMSVDRFDERLNGHAAGDLWEAVVAWDGDAPVGYAYGSGVPAGGSGRWRSVVPRPSPHFADEPGGRTFVLFELMVRTPWRKTGAARTIHDALLDGRPEPRTTLTVERDHPKVQALYETWGYTCIGTKQPFPDSPVYAVMVRNLST